MYSLILDFCVLYIYIYIYHSLILLMLYLLKFVFQILYVFQVKKKLASTTSAFKSVFGKEEKQQDVAVSMQFLF